MLEALEIAAGVVAALAVLAYFFVSWSD